MSRFSVLFIACVFLPLLFSNARQETAIRHNLTFGVKIGIMPTGKITQYAFFMYRNGRFSGLNPVELNQLIKVGTGEWPVPGTNKFHDYFDEQGIYDIGVTMNNGDSIDFNAAFDSLWKIRYVMHPFDASKGNGWSQGDARPSSKQQEYIYNTYGVRGYDQEYFTDTSFFKLLRDVLDTDWIKNYKSLR